MYNTSYPHPTSLTHGGIQFAANQLHTLNCLFFRASGVDLDSRAGPRALIYGPGPGLGFSLGPSGGPGPDPGLIRRARAGHGPEIKARAGLCWARLRSEVKTEDRQMSVVTVVVSTL